MGLISLSRTAGRLIPFPYGLGRTLLSECLHGSSLARGLPLRCERSWFREGFEDRLTSDAEIVMEGMLGQGVRSDALQPGESRKNVPKE